MLISEEYKEAIRAHRGRNPAWGSKAYKALPHINQLVKLTGAYSVIDYGCAKGRLVDLLIEQGLEAYGYDPCVEEFSVDPPVCDVIACRDVMEHVERECVDEVLAHMRSKARKAAWLLIVLRETKDWLEDGRNAHITVLPGETWIELLGQHWARVDVRQHKANDILNVFCFTEAA